MTRNFRTAGFWMWGLACVLGVTSAIAESPVEDSEELFQKFDRDRDGQLSTGEIGAFKFGRYDNNGDGVVSQAEFVAARLSDRRLAVIETDPEKAWALLDWNSDGRLSGTELDGKWERFDIDGDGRVSKSEFMTARSRPGSTPPASKPRTPANPPAAASNVKSLWGQRLADARQADFFRFFNLEQLPGGNLLELGQQLSFQPKAGPFRELVLVQLTVDKQSRIRAAELLLARSFVDDPRNNLFARDIAKSFLLQQTPPGELTKVQPLINEIQFGAPGLVVAEGTTVPALPNPPTRGYQTFLGKQYSFEQSLGDTQLFLLSNDPGEDSWFTISLQPKTEDAM